MSTPVIEVRIWGRRVGAVAADPTAGAYVFEYDPAWRRTGIELAPLTMPVAKTMHLFPELPIATYKGLPGLLADALPDDFGNALIDAWMARQGVAKADITTLDRLAYMGRRGMGALEFRPARGSHRESKRGIELKQLFEAARKAVHGELGEDALSKSALENILRVGTSAGGARAKAVIAWNPVTEEVRSGQFDVEPGFEHWLLKFDGLGKDNELGMSADYGRIEYAYHRMALAAGIEMAPCRLLHENGRAHFMTRRFDRTGNTKHHVQTLCAMQHLDFKQRATHAYEQWFMAMAAIGLSEADTNQAFTRLCFNVAAKNCDDHTKNIAFLMKEGERWQLAPAYDVTFAYNPNGEWTYQHLMSVNGQFAGITRDDLMAIADRFGVTRAREVLRRVDDAVGAWSGFAREAGLGEKTTSAIQQHHQRLGRVSTKREKVWTTAEGV